MRSCLLSPFGLLLLALLPAQALAQPRAGEPLPHFRAPDLNDKVHTQEDLRGRPTLLVAITERGGEQAMRRWFTLAQQQAPRGVRPLAVASLQLPFFVSDGLVRSEARKRTPHHAWTDTFVDARGQLARALGLAQSPRPWVLALDAGGRVLHVFHGEPDAPGARAVWRAFEREEKARAAPAPPPEATPPPPRAAPPAPRP
jgi:hypothetical protein